MKKYALTLLLAGCAPLLLAVPSELTTINNATLIEGDKNDGDSFMVNADGRELYLRLYFVDSPETTASSKTDLERIQEQQFHFGLAEPQEVVYYGEQAAEYLK